MLMGYLFSTLLFFLPKGIKSIVEGIYLNLEGLLEGVLAEFRVFFLFNTLLRGSGHERVVIFFLVAVHFWESIS